MRAAVVLAAGFSRRMGTDKLLLEVGGAPMYRHALRLATALPVRTRIVVTNHPAIAREAEVMGFTAVPSPRAGEGMGCSVAAGAAALGSEGCAVFLNADQPFLQVETVKTLLDACHARRACSRIGFTGNWPRFRAKWAAKWSGSGIRLGSCACVLRTQPHLPMWTRGSSMPALTARGGYDMIFTSYNRILCAENGKSNRIRRAQERGFTGWKGPARRRRTCARERRGQCPAGFARYCEPRVKMRVEPRQYCRLFGETEGAVFE